MYKPTQKCMMVHYDTIDMVRAHDMQPCKYEIICKLAYDAMNLQKMLPENNEYLVKGLITQQTLTSWKNDVFKLRKVLGSDLKYQKFLECYSKNP